MKIMKRRKFVNHKKRVMYFSWFFMLLFISVGYAYLSAALKPAISLRADSVIKSGFGSKVDPWIIE